MLKYVISACGKLIQEVTFINHIALRQTNTVNIIAFRNVQNVILIASSIYRLFKLLTQRFLHVSCIFRIRRVVVNSMGWVIGFILTNDHVIPWLKGLFLLALIWFFGLTGLEVVNFRGLVSIIDNLKSTVIVFWWLNLGTFFVDGLFGVFRIGFFSIVIKNIFFFHKLF